MTSEAPTLDADVVIVGCGPVGVMAGLRCVQRGLTVIAIDKSPDIYPLPRAIAMDDETQRVLQNAGLLDQLRAHSTPILGGEFVDADHKRVVGIEFETGTLGVMSLPPIVAFDQPGVEGFLRRAAAAAGVEFRFGPEAVGITEWADRASVDLTGPQPSITGRWVIASDGASSTIRKHLGIRFIDQGFDQPWLVVDATQLEPGLGLTRLAQQICDPSRVITVVPGHADRRRWEFHLHDDEPRELAEGPEFVASLLAPWGTPEQIRVDRIAWYRFHAVVAERFSIGHVFLAGDAAHQTPPFNGQGMCAGIRDAENLSWKLAEVAHGRADERLLDTYDIERRPHAVGQVAHAADAGRLMDAIAAGVDTSVEAGYGGGRPFPHIEAGLIDGSGPGIGSPLPQPMIDGVMLDDMLGSGWSVVTTSPLNAGQLESVARLGATVVPIDASTMPFLLTAGSAVVVRPDRYVAGVSKSLSELPDLIDRLTRKGAYPGVSPR